MKPVRSVLVVDDLAPTRGWLQQALQQAFDAPQVVEAESLASARAQAEAGPLPDLALVDLRLPDGHGSTLIRELRQRSDDLLIVVPTIFDDDAYLFEALRAGADGYVLKDHALPKLAQALRTLAAGQPSLSPPLARRLLRLADEHRLMLHGPERTLLQSRARGVPAAEAARLTGMENGAADAALRAVYTRLRSA
jgi:DNA-binding NarL/FixJ family response regulator